MLRLAANNTEHRSPFRPTPEQERAADGIRGLWVMGCMGCFTACLTVMMPWAFWSLSQTPVKRRAA